MKPFWQSKTIWLGVITALLGFLEQVQAIPDLPPPAVTCLGVLIVALRLVTGKPIGKEYRE
jgi:hypothetical protein